MSAIRFQAAWQRIDQQETRHRSAIFPEQCEEVSMSFPQELRMKTMGVLAAEPDKDGGKPRKMPINPITGKGVMSNNPNTWMDYQTAFEAYEVRLYGHRHMFP